MNRPAKDVEGIGAPPDLPVSGSTAVEQITRREVPPESEGKSIEEIVDDLQEQVKGLQEDVSAQVTDNNEKFKNSPKLQADHSVAANILNEGIDTAQLALENAINHLRESKDLYSERGTLVKAGKIEQVREIDRKLNSIEWKLKKLPQEAVDSAQAEVAQDATVRRTEEKIVPKKEIVHGEDKQKEASIQSGAVRLRQLRTRQKFGGTTLARTKEEGSEEETDEENDVFEGAVGGGGAILKEKESTPFKKREKKDTTPEPVEPLIKDALQEANEAFEAAEAAAGEEMSEIIPRHRLLNFEAEQPIDESFKEPLDVAVDTEAEKSDAQAEEVPKRKRGRPKKSQPIPTPEEPILEDTTQDRIDAVPRGPEIKQDDPEINPHIEAAQQEAYARKKYGIVEQDSVYATLRERLPTVLHGYIDRIEVKGENRTAESLSVRLAELQAKIEKLENDKIQDNEKLVEAQGQRVIVENDNKLVATKKEKLLLQFDKTIEQLNKNIEDADEQISRLKEEAALLQPELAVAQKSRNEAINRIEATLNEKISPREEQLGHLTSEVERLEGEIKNFEGEKDRIKGEIDDLKISRIGVKGISNVFVRRNIDKAIAAYEKELSKAEKLINKRKGEIGVLKAKIAPLGAKLNNWKLERDSFLGLRGEVVEQEELIEENEDQEIAPESNQESGESEIEPEPESEVESVSQVDPLSYRGPDLSQIRAGMHTQERHLEDIPQGIRTFIEEWNQYGKEGNIDGLEINPDILTRDGIMAEIKEEMSASSTHINFDNLEEEDKKVFLEIYMTIKKREEEMTESLAAHRVADPDFNPDIQERNKWRKDWNSIWHRGGLLVRWFGLPNRTEERKMIERRVEIAFRNFKAASNQQ